MDLLPLSVVQRLRWRIGARPVVAAVVAAAALLGLPREAPAQATDAGGGPGDGAVAGSPPPDPATPPAAAPDSPRASLAEYLALAREGRLAEAAAYLAVPETQRERAPALAARLKAVLDRHVWVDLDLVSGLAQGEPADGLPAATDRVGWVPAPRGAPEPVLLVKGSSGDPRWAFSRGTVARIDGWYDALEDRWLRERLPAALLRPGPRELLWYQWLSLPLLLLAALALGRLSEWVVLGMATRVAARTKGEWDDALVRAMRGPAAVGSALLVAYVLLPVLGLYAPAAAFVAGLLRAAGLLVVLWALWRCVDAAVALLRDSRWGQLGSSTRALVQIGQRLAKAVLVALVLVGVLAELGYPVAGLVAGLGIGGLALALAAQKTGENLFGSLALALDRPFGVGDFVKIEDMVGTVEVIGLRSTQVRTLDRTLVTIPNGRLADMRLESLTARDRMRLSCTVGLVYGTTPAQMRSVLEGLEDVLRSHPSIWPDAIVVRFREFAASSLDIEVMAWFQTSVWPEFQLIRQDVLLRFMEVVERAGTSFAFPTYTVHIAREAGADAGRRVRAG
jgi:MscS family membrane protein